jgi:hypothetical protein
VLCYFVAYQNQKEVSEVSEVSSPLIRRGFLAGHLTLTGVRGVLSPYTTRVWVVNPEVHRRFEARAQKEAVTYGYVWLRIGKSIRNR